MFDKDITVINKYVRDRETKYKVTRIKGFWSSEDGISINGIQLENTNNCVARILMTESGYQDPKEFTTNPTGWTLQKDDYLVKGQVGNFTTISDLLDNYEEVMKIVRVGVKDYGSSNMQHFAIIGA